MSKAQGPGLLADRPLLTIQVSRDSGRTWGPERGVYTRDGLTPLITTEWPPCLCPRCVGAVASPSLGISLHP